MLCDHIGAYLFPDIPLLRVIGRLCVPIWLFLIGYANSRRIDAVLLAAACYVSFAKFILLDDFSGLNILWSIIILRLTLNPLMDFILNRPPSQRENMLYGITFALMPFAVLTRGWLEYGTMIWLFGMWGYIARNGFPITESTAKPAAKNTKHPEMHLLYGALVLILFVVIETLAMDFTIPYTILLAIGLVPIGLALCFYLPSQRMVGAALPAPIRRLTAFMARHTLGFYTIHLTVIWALHMALYRCPESCFQLPFGIDPAAFLH